MRFCEKAYRSNDDELPGWLYTCLPGVGLARLDGPGLMGPGKEE